MKTKLLIFVALAVSLVFSSCTKDDPDNFPLNLTVPQISSIKFYGTDGVLTGIRTFDYDSNKRLIKDSYNSVGGGYKYLWEATYSGAEINIAED